MDDSNAEKAKSFGILVRAGRIPLVILIKPFFFPETHFHLSTPSGKKNPVVKDVVQAALELT